MYAKGLRDAVRGLWRDDLSQTVFIGDVSSLMETRLRQAWFEGAAECAIYPDEITPSEQVKLATAIQEHLAFIPGFASDIIANSKDRGGKLTPLMTRVDQLWVNRYFQFKNEGLASACGDVKLMWVYGLVEEHCVSCIKLHGKVKRGSYWYSRGILPRRAGATYLECHGFGFCSLVPTEEPVSPGPLPALP